MVSFSSLGGAGWQFFDSNGTPLAGGKLYTYAAGTTTPLATYTDNTGNTPHSNPIILDSAGRISSQLWLNASNSYKFTLTSSTDITVWTKDNISGITTSSELAAANGSSFINFLQSGTGAVVRSVQSKLRDTTSVKDFGAIDGRDGAFASANLTAVNSAISAVARAVDIPEDNIVISNQPTNPTGVEYDGAGKLLMQDPEGNYHQLNTYADKYITVGREYLSRAYARIAQGPAGATSQLKVFCYGDSTVEGYLAPPAVRNGYFLLQFMLPRLFKQEGIHNVSVTNRGVSGTSWPDLNAIPDLAADTDLFIIKYAINDRTLPPAGTPDQKIAQMAANMDAKLTAIRAATFGGIQQLSIILVGPNATKDQVNQRNEEWYEEVRRLYVAMARKHGCAYFDTYAYLRDARLGGNLWLDSALSGSEIINIHPLDNSNQWIWAGVVRHCFPQQEHSYWGANNFTVTGEQGGTAVLAKAPSDYGSQGEYGETWEFAKVADGFPAEGLLKTSLQPDRFATQELFPLAGTGRVFRRFGVNASAWAAYWTGQSVALTYQNGWGAPPAGDQEAYAVRGEDGIVTLGGAIAGGTTAALTKIAILPASYRPFAYEYAYAATTTAVPALLRIDPDGSVFLLTTGDATRTSLAGISFKAI